MSTLELADLLNQEVVENPLLEEVPTEDLTAQEQTALRHYIRERARYKPSFSEQVGAAWHYLVLMIKMKLKAWGWIS